MKIIKLLPLKVYPFTIINEVALTGEIEIVGIYIIAISLNKLSALVD